MSIPKVRFPIFLLGLFCLQNAHSQPHPYNQLGRAVFESFRDRDLSKFVENSVFALEEDEFRNLLSAIKNDALIAQLREGSQEDWSIVFAKNWRKHWRHIAKHLKSQIGAKAFAPILTAAKADGIQWQTTELTAIEVLLPVKLEQGHFEVKRDTFTPKVTSIDTNDTSKTEWDSGTLYFDRGLAYRLRMDKSTHGFGFMIGKKPEDSENRFDSGIQRNGAGVGDILVEFEKRRWPSDTLSGSSLNKVNATKIHEELTGKKPSSETLKKLADSSHTVNEFVSEIHEKHFPSHLYYFCPDRKGVGGTICVKDSNDLDKPNQRIDLLLTFDFGQPKRSYQILVREILSTPRGPLFFEKPKWLGVVGSQVGTN
ncbi:MAG: hypothetical protein CMI26_00315 [Opitutae bacterium]|jgi:hypothetical protein|nr:hypothetical protein [Opitutae bacterium]|tara:strand:- start:1112 stop:2218 length:1107 start_codon:yes stop_codon:yes gene_type:complete